MEHYQEGYISDPYKGTYLLCIPLCVLLVTDMIADYFVAIRVRFIKTTLSYMNNSMTILILLLFGIYMNRKLNISTMAAIFDRFLLAFFCYDKASIIRSILSVYKVSDKEVYSLTKIMLQILLFETFISMVEVWFYFSFNKNRTWILLLYVPIYILLMKLSDMEMNKTYNEILGSKKSSFCLREEENDRWLLFIGDFARFNLFVGLTNTFLFLDLDHQYVSQMGIVLFSSRCLKRTMSLSTFLFMIDDIRKVNN